MSISLVGSVVGSDTGQANYVASGTVTNSASVTTAVGDLVFVFHSYAPASYAAIYCTLTGGTGAWTSSTAIGVSYGNFFSQAFYRTATVAQTFGVVATLDTAATNRRITVAVFRSSTGTLTFASGTDLQSFADSVPYPGTITGPAFSAANYSIVMCGFATGGSNAPSGIGQNGFTAGTSSDFDLVLYKTVSTASTQTPALDSNDTDVRVRFAGFVFTEPPPYTYARPSSDITKQWTPSSGSDHYAMIDEVTASDADYISATAAGQTTEVKLQSMTAPQPGTSVAIGYRVQGVTGSAGVTVSMVQGTTVIATDTTRTANGDYTLTVSSGTWASVTDWTDIRLRFVSS